MIATGSIGSDAVRIRASSRDSVEFKAAAREEQWLEPGLLTVLDADADIEAIYRHFVEDLGATGVSTLLPDCSHDDGIPNGHSAEAYGRMLCKLFDLWIENEAVQMREIHRLLGRFQKYGNEILQEPKSGDHRPIRRIPRHG